MNNRIVILNQWFDPEPTFKGLLFAKELQKKGYSVEVITGFPNFPGGKIYEGHKLRLYKKEVIDGVVVHRVYLYPSHDTSKVKRILNYGSFALTSLIFGLFFLKRPKAIYVYHPPLTTGVVAMILSKIKRIPFVYDIQDLWPDTLSSTGMITNKKVLKVIDKVASAVYKSSHTLVVLSKEFKLELIKRGVPSEKIRVIYNWADERYIQNDESNKGIYSNLFNITYAGNFGAAQDLTVLISAAEILKEHKNIKITLIGDGQEKEKLVNLISKKNLRNIEILPSVPVTKISEYLNQSDALIIHLKEDPLFKMTIPGKTQAYLAVGKPIIMGVSGAAKNIILESKAGLVVESSNPLSIANGILELSNYSVDKRNEMGQNGLAFYRNNLSLSSGVSEFSSIFKEIT